MRDQLLEIWQQSAADVIALCEPLTEDQWQALTPCPGWSVADIVAHLIDVESMVAGDPRPDVVIDWTNFPHITNDLGRATELGVELRRGRPKTEVLDEFRAMMERRGEQLADVHGDVRSPFGNTIPVERLLSMRIFDTWVHEQDIRIAIDQSGGMDSMAGFIAANAMFSGLAKAWGKTVNPGNGKTLRVIVTGPFVERDVAYRIDDDGRAIEVEPGDADVTLTMTWPDYFLLATGRIDADDEDLRARISAAGDTDLVAKSLRALNVAP
jgi:uncharacterized protein (TIGR03083 family)